MSKTSVEKDTDFSKLTNDLTVKNLGKKLGKPSIFIGSSKESLPIVNYIKKQFEKRLFEVDSWDSGIFGPVDENTTNIHWLKNFTDIYDFAIFLFVPDDKIVSQTRKNEKGEMLEGIGTRHNVVFEFGLFLGRIGSKKTYILFDKKTEEFVNDFFTDLKGSTIYSEKNFIKLYDYDGKDEEWLHPDVKSLENNPRPLKEKVIQIKENILKDINDVEIGFLPSTALAIGYFNNFLKIVVENINKIRRPEIPEEIINKCNKDDKMKVTVDAIRKKKKIEIKVLIPKKLTGAKHKEFKKKYEEGKLAEICIPGTTRNMTAYCSPESLTDSANEFIICDVPSTMNSSIDSIKMLNPAIQIRQLLSEKEVRNFSKSVRHIIATNKEKNIRNINKIVTISTWEDFRNTLSR